MTPKDAAKLPPRVQVRLVAAADVALALAEKLGADATRERSVSSRWPDLRGLTVAALLVGGAAAFNAAMAPRVTGPNPHPNPEG